MRAMPSPPPASMSLMVSRCYSCSSSASPPPPPPPPPPKQRRDAESKKQQPIRGPRLAVTRRAHAASLLAAVVVGSATAGRASAEEEKAEDDGGGGGGGEGVLGAVKSIFDPNERTKAGKVLPKAYLKAAREVVQTLRESLEEDVGGDVAKFRRGADAAKESIREFLGGWRGQQAVAAEESYVALERAIRSLAEFYSKAGPFASLPKDVRIRSSPTSTLQTPFCRNFFCQKNCICQQSTSDTCIGTSLHLTCENIVGKNRKEQIEQMITSKCFPV